MKKVLIVGLGISGISAAINLYKAGWEVVIIERASERRKGGYFIGLFPGGVKAADKIGAYNKMNVKTPISKKSFEINGKGKRIRSFGFQDQPGNPQTLLRGDIEEGLWQTLSDKVIIHYNTVPIEITQCNQKVNVILKNTSTDELEQETFDLVIGADGLRSTVRSLVFGPHSDYMKPLNAIIVAFKAQKELPGLKQGESLTIAKNKRSLWFFGLENSEPSVLFTYRTKRIDDQFKYSIKDVLKSEYKNKFFPEYIDYALSELEKNEKPVIDSVHQIKMPKWSKGNVVLLGDAAWCLTLYSGMGASSGMIGANTLGEKLVEHPDNIKLALNKYESELRPFIKKNQKMIFLKSQMFVPSNKMLKFLRKVFIYIMVKFKFNKNDF